ncbi:MAG: hypothetical protein S4CHLAM6_01890 [Chlamydiae bacterium]|nr:hypothetical protein [Chlamydiota bacterium]
MTVEFKIATLPKAGTHLLLKCLKSMKALPDLPESIYGGITFDSHLRDKYGWHLTARVLDEVTSEKNKHIVMVRDIRDAILSIHNWLPYLYKKVQEEERLEPFQEAFDGNIDSQILGLIEESPEIDGNFLVKRYRLAQELYKNKESYPQILFVKYEDLIGPKGGGSESKQIQTIHKIAHFLEIELEKSKVQKIAKEIWGNTETYNVSQNKGMVSEWQRRYTFEHIQAVQHHWNEYLLTFEYEKTEDWHKQYPNIQVGA